jgi:2'-5' RNA ligase
MRTFLALRPPAAAVEHLSAVLDRWPSDPRRWHLTLVFLGEVDRPEALVPALGRVCAGLPALRLRLAGSGAFGRGGPVWVGVDGDVAGLTGLAGALAEACRSAGRDVERRPYRPHVTVGRRGHPDPRRLASYEGPAWTAAEVEVVGSRLGPPVEHRTLVRLPLGAA